MYVFYRRPHCRGYGAEIWHGAGVQPQEGFSECLGQLDPTPWAGDASECFWRSAQPKPCISRKTYKIKVEGHPRFSVGGSRQMRSRTSPRGLAASPSVRGRSAAVVIGPIELKLGRCFTLMGTWPQKCFGLIRPQPPGQGWSVQPKLGISGKTL